MRYSEMMRSSIPAGESGDVCVDKFFVSEMESSLNRVICKNGGFGHPVNSVRTVVADISHEILGVESSNLSGRTTNLSSYLALYFNR